MKAATEAKRNKEMCSCKASRVFNYHKQHCRVLLKTGRTDQLKQ